MNGNTLKHLMAQNGHSEEKSINLKKSESERMKNLGLYQTFHLKNIKPVASVFFRFSHRDKGNAALSNKAQKTIVEDIYAKMLTYIDRQQQEAPTVSSTLV